MSSSSTSLLLPDTSTSGDAGANESRSSLPKSHSIGIITSHPATLAISPNPLSPTFAHAKKTSVDVAESLVAKAAMTAANSPRDDDRGMSHSYSLSAIQIDAHPGSHPAGPQEPVEAKEAAAAAPTPAATLSAPPTVSVDRKPSLLHIRGTNKRLALCMVGLPARGKCFGIDTPLLMYDGSVRRVQNIKPADLLMGDDGTPRVVQAESLVVGRAPLYEIAATDGSCDPVIVNAEHILVLTIEQPHIIRQTLSADGHVRYETRCIHAADGDSNTCAFRLQTQSFISRAAAANHIDSLLPLTFEMSLTEFVSLSTSVDRTDRFIFRRAKLFAVNAVEFAADRNSQSIIARRICKQFAYKMSDKLIEEVAWAIGLCIGNSVAAKSNTRQSKAVTDRLRAVTLRDEHPITAAVIASLSKRVCDIRSDTLNVRRCIVAGILDAHNAQSHNANIKIEVRRSELTDDAVFIFRSIGVRVRRMRHHVVLCGTQTCNIQQRRAAPDCMNLHNEPPSKCSSIAPFSFSIRSAGVDAYYGFTVDGNGRFLLGDLTVTHNTYIGKKLSRYLNWSSYQCDVFNIGVYRRKLFGAEQHADFFDDRNELFAEQRKQCAVAALTDMIHFFQSGGQAAIYDGTNTTKERRAMVTSLIERQAEEAGLIVEIVWIESIVNDLNIVDENIRESKLTMPDYSHMSADDAANDFMKRIAHYAETYEQLPIDSDQPYVKIIDAGRQVHTNRIVGYLMGKIVFFLMNLRINRAPIYISRHGESAHNLLGLIGGDSGLSSRGIRYAQALAQFITEENEFKEALQHDLSVWTSTMKRTLQTASYLTLPVTQWRALIEIQVGICDNMTYEAIAEKYPDEFMARQRDKLRYRYPQGESYLDVIQRLEPCILELERMQTPVLLIVHRAVARCLLAYFTDIDQQKIPHLDMPLHTVLKLQPKAYSCLTADHQVLTRSGWKDIADVQRTDDVMTFNTSKRQQEWNRVNLAYRTPYNGALYQLSSARMNAVCDSGHRWLVNSANRPTQYEFYSVKQLLSADTFDEGQWKNGLHETHSVPLVGANANSDYTFDECRFLPHNARQSKSFREDFMRLVGFIMGNGGIQHEAGHNGQQSYYLTLTQSSLTKPNAYDWLSTLLRRIALLWPIIAAKPSTDGRNRCTWRIACGQEVYAWFLPMFYGPRSYDPLNDQLCKSYSQAEYRSKTGTNKDFNTRLTPDGSSFVARLSLGRWLYYDWIFKLSTSQSRALIEGFAAANGQWSLLEASLAGADIIHKQYVSVRVRSIPLLHDLSIVGLMANSDVKVSVRGRKAYDKTSNGRMSDSRSCAVNWLIRFNLDANEHVTPLPRPRIVTNPRHDGYVYCLSVANSNFMARRKMEWANDKEQRIVDAFSQACFTGNCEVTSFKFPIESIEDQPNE